MSYAKELPVEQYKQVSMERLLDELIYVTAETEYMSKTSEQRKKQALIKNEILLRYLKARHSVPVEKF